MKDKNIEKIWNIEQCQFYLESGCKMLKVGKSYSDKLSRIGIFHEFIIDDIYLEAKRKWFERDR